MLPKNTEIILRKIKGFLYALRIKCLFQKLGMLPSFNVEESFGYHNIITEAVYYSKHWYKKIPVKHY